MNADSLPALLQHGRRWLWLQRAFALARRAALLSVLLEMLLLAAHLLLQPVPAQLALAALALPLCAAAVLGFQRRPARVEVARWLDVQLDAHSVFSTHLEFVADRSSTGSAAALEAFSRWSNAALPRIAAKPEGLPPLRAARTVAFVLLAALPAAAVLGLPGLQNVGAVPRSDAAAAELISSVPQEQANRGVLSALRGENHESKPAAAPGSSRPTAAGAPDIQQAIETPSGEAPPRAMAGTARVDGDGSTAGDNTPGAARRGVAFADAALAARFRDVAGRSGGDGGAASGEALAIVVSARSRETAEFDRRQQLLAGRAAATELDRSAQRRESGPAETALLNRFSRLRNTP